MKNSALRAPSSAQRASSASSSATNRWRFGEPRELIVVREMQQPALALLQRAVVSSSAVTIARSSVCGELGKRTAGSPAASCAERVLQLRQRRERALQEPAAAGPRDAEQQQQHAARDREPRPERALVRREVEIDADEAEQLHRRLGGRGIGAEQRVVGKRLGPDRAGQTIALARRHVLRQQVRRLHAGARRELGRGRGVESGGIDERRAVAAEREQRARLRCRTTSRARSRGTSR